MAFFSGPLAVKVTLGGGLPLSHHLGLSVFEGTPFWQGLTGNPKVSHNFEGSLKTTASGRFETATNRVRGTAAVRGSVWQAALQDPLEGLAAKPRDLAIHKDRLAAWQTVLL